MHFAPRYLNPPIHLFHTKIFAERSEQLRGREERKKRNIYIYNEASHKVAKNHGEKTASKVIIVITPIYLPRRAKLSAACNFLCREGGPECVGTLDGR